MKRQEPGSGWYELDNAAKIYPATSSVRFPVAFRLTCRLVRPIRVEALQLAAETMLRRCPYFQVYLRRGLFWYYLQRHHDPPRVRILDSRTVLTMHLRGHASPLFRVSARERTIAVDFSHIITDGSGGTRFVTALLAEYLRRCGVAVDTGDSPLDPHSVPDAEEAEDAHRRYYMPGLPRPRPLPPAYHLPGRPRTDGRFRAITGTMPAQRVSALGRRLGGSITELLTAIYLRVIVLAHAEETAGGRRPRRSIIRVEVPVDMRRFHPSRTMRNFSLYVAPEIDLRLGTYELEELVGHVHHSMQVQLERRQLNRQISRNVAAELHPLVRPIPLPLKDRFLKLTYWRLGGRLYSGVLSNLGRIELGESVARHVEAMGLLPGPNRATKKSCGVIGFRDQLTVTFGSVTVDRSLERAFYGMLVHLGVPVRIREG